MQIISEVKTAEGLLISVAKTKRGYCTTIIDQTRNICVWESDSTRFTSWHKAKAAYYRAVRRGY